MNPSDIFLFSDLKRIYAAERHSDNEMIMIKTDAYFEAKYTIKIISES